MKKVIFILSFVLTQIYVSAQTAMQPDSALTFTFEQSGDSTLVMSQIYQYDALSVLQKEIRTVHKYYSALFLPGVFHYMYNHNYQISDCFMMAGKDTAQKEHFEYLENAMIYSKAGQHIEGYWDEETDEDISDTTYIVWKKGTFYGLRDYAHSPLLDILLQAFTFENLIFYYSDSIIFEQTKGFFDTVFQVKNSIYFSYDEDKLTCVTLHVIFGDFEFELFYNQDSVIYKVEASQLSYLGDSIVKTKTDGLIRTFDTDGKPMEDYLYTINFTPSENYKTIYNYDNERNILSEIKYSVSDSSDVGYPVEKKYYFYKSTSKISQYNKNTIAVFPNPAHTQFTVTNAENATITMYNLVGQKVKQVVGKTENTIIHTTDLPAGMYILKVENGNGVVTKKVQVVK